MWLLDRLKAVLGLANGREPPGERETADRERGGVTTVEREPSTAAEDAVKGTDTGTETGGEAGEPVAEGPSADAGEAEAETADTQGGEPLETITGIGPAYAERLQDAGVADTAALADADAAALAEATDLSAKRIQGWIDQAAE